MWFVYSAQAVPKQPADCSACWCRLMFVVNMPVRYHELKRFEIIYINKKMNLPVIFQSLYCFNLMTFDLLYFCNGSNVRAGCQAAAGVSRLPCVNVQSEPALCRNKAELQGHVYTSVHRSVLFMAF